MPQAEGLFARAIAESPAAAWFAVPKWPPSSPTGSRRCWGAFPDAAHTLLRVSPTELLAAQDRLLADGTRDMLGAFPIGPVFGDDLLPLDPVEAMRRGSAHQVPLIVGSNAHEGRLFTRFLKMLPTTEPMVEAVLANTEAGVRDRIIAAYPDYPDRKACIRLGGDFAFNAAVWEIAEAHGAHAPTYVYRYDYAPRMLRWSGMGATHATELFAVFDVYRSGGLGDCSLPARTGGRRCGSVARCSGAGGHSAGTGARRRLATYDRSDRAVMVFDHKTRVEFDPSPERRMAWAGFTLAR